MTDHGTGWQFSSETTTVGSNTLTLLEGTSFCLCGSDGDIDGRLPQGVFFRDTRIISEWRMTVDGGPVEPLSVITETPFHATFVGRMCTKSPGSPCAVLVRRDRYIGAGMREDIELRNLGMPLACEVTVKIAADFADLFEVKEGRVSRAGHYIVETADDGLRAARTSNEHERGIWVRAPGAHVSPEAVTYQVHLPSRATWSTTIRVRPQIDGDLLPAPFPDANAEERSPAAIRARHWREHSPVLIHSDDPELARTLRRSREDLGALRIFGGIEEEQAIAAGAPWFMALFGRDSLLTSIMALPVDPGLALGSAEVLARYQGRRVDAASEEEPGRILHEIRTGAEASLALGGGRVYYGTADATPLFVMLLGALHRWGYAPERVRALLPNADRALEWIDSYGDRDGDGFVEYERTSARGLVNQGWKDSWDGINFADGRIAAPPIALSEVQAYVYGAYRARAEIGADLGEEKEARHWSARAADLKRRFNERFWLEDEGRYAVGLDRDKAPIDALASNMGHCLWTGIADEDKAERVAALLFGPEMFSGWGVRTLATSMGAYNPMSYHNGSVWPHDNALIGSGLMRYGQADRARRLAKAVLGAARAFNGRLPELMCGFDRADFPEPIPYPTSCSPQAWAAAAPIYCLRTLLRIRPDIPRRQVHVAAEPVGGLGDLHIEGLALAGVRLTLRVRGGRVELEGLPPDIEQVDG